LQNAQNNFIEAKMYKNIKISDTTPNSVLNIDLAVGNI